jgi:hypothetical protein
MGLDVHKKPLSFCVKDTSGRIQQQGAIPATRIELGRRMKTLLQRWMAAMEATLFPGWVYDHLLPHAAQVKLAHPGCCARLQPPEEERPNRCREDCGLSAV